ncbi:complement regulator-acquiring protein (plasmid) [Borreliella valaisiana]|uniref:complement regulator-acquiring protein n=1 Tax=Borreliella valaisiana TaxID=62088 RepID=UPI00273805EE|nr:complement regulator-acquiring protein [Borreliella valaisiana]WKC76667.1 complement regulator-acquiring protein [Borreliella valaisiana]WLN25719.1 complement regulator-acquiring protein [Borreliella valaisiana]WVN14682.1 complement regulator-acquiring protein [Borreliella valaisiana]
MTNTKLNIIKLNIITAILTLICISCAPINTINPKETSNTNKKETINTNKKENNQNFENKSNESGESGESENLEHLYQEYQDLKIEIEKYKEDEASQLKAIKNHLEKQKNKETEGIAKVDAEIAKTDTQSDFLKTFTADTSYDHRDKDLLAIKRIIYSSLYYNATRVKTLTEIIEKLHAHDEHNIIVTRLLYPIALGIQLQLESCLENITKDELHLPIQQDSKNLLEFAKSGLKEKDDFGKALNKTINDYNRNSGEIKTDIEKLANYMNEQFPDYDFKK